MGSRYITRMAVMLMGFSILGSQYLRAYEDQSHYSQTFEEVRFFRVFTPQAYRTEGKRYPVIYYFHGCGGNYERSGPYSYADYGLKPPKVLDDLRDPAYAHANNADFENEADAKDVIIVCVDGRLQDLPENGCRVYFPTLTETWTSNFYNFSDYIKELIPVVDTRYRTIEGPAHRAVTGLSMGGHMATWVAATNPHLFSSASQFCHGPSFYDVGEPSYQTTVDLKELWRNLRGVPFRHITTDRDYLRYYTEDLFRTFYGAGFGNVYYLADYCHHAAARVDLQVDFHRSHFGQKKEASCFSHINLYPQFNLWGYQVSSSKQGNGWIYLHDVTSNGLGVYTRQRLPWGRPLAPFDITVTTPDTYVPNASYTVARYDYASGRISTATQVADSQGRLLIGSQGGRGEEIGISGKDLQPPVFVLTDTTNELIYLEVGKEMVRAVDIVNLSLSEQLVAFESRTEDKTDLSILKKMRWVKLPALSKTRVDSFHIIKGSLGNVRSTRSYIKIGSSINGVRQDRTQIVPVQIINRTLTMSDAEVKVFDGRGDDLPVFSYIWNQWDEPLDTAHIAEGQGNGNGIPEADETISLWIQSAMGYDSTDVSTWHPIVPICDSETEGFEWVRAEHHRFSTREGSAFWNNTSYTSTHKGCTHHHSF